MSNYVFVGESSSVQVFEDKSGTRLMRIIVVPLSKTPESIQLKDGSGNPMVIYVGKGDLVQISNIESMNLELGMKSESGGWTIITGKDVACWVVGE